MLIRAICFLAVPILLWKIKRLNKKYKTSAISSYEAVPFLDNYFDKQLLLNTRVVYLKEVPLVKVPFIPVKKPVGIALEGTYYLQEDYKHKWHLHFHELVHIHQWQREGSHVFLSKYLTEALINGYRANKFEVEAHEYEERFKRNQVFKIY